MAMRRSYRAATWATGPLRWVASHHGSFRPRAQSPTTRTRTAGREPRSTACPGRKGQRAKGTLSGHAQCRGSRITPPMEGPARSCKNCIRLGRAKPRSGSSQSLKDFVGCP